MGLPLNISTDLVWITELPILQAFPLHKANVVQEKSEYIFIQPLLYTYSAQVLPFVDLFCSSTCIWWPILNTNIHFGDLICTCTSLCWPLQYSNIYLRTSSVHQHVSGDWICMYTFFCWPILYTSIHLMTYSVLVSPSVNLFYSCISNWQHFSISWPVLYSYIYLGACLVHQHTSGDLFCTYTSFYTSILSAPPSSGLLCTPTSIW